jgi:hypothetical protein
MRGVLLVGLLAIGCTTAAEPAASTEADLAAPVVTTIGDSHSDYEGNAVGAFGYFGYHLRELMTGAGNDYALYAASGSSPTWWFDDTAVQAATWGYSQSVTFPARTTCHRGSKSGPCVPKLGVVTQKRPHLFVIEQGTNLLGLSSASITQQINKLLQQIAGKVDACLWVGAPNARTNVHSPASQDELWQLIRTNAGATCTVYDSRFVPRTDATGHPVLDAHGDLIMDVPLPYSPDANDDGEHLGKVAAGKWAEGVALMIAHVEASL